MKMGCPMWGVPVSDVSFNISIIMITHILLVLLGFFVGGHFLVTGP